MSGTGAARGAKPIERSAIYCILNNRAYIGETTHKGNSYPGEHEAIVPRDLFDQVHRRLAELRPLVTTGTRAPQEALLAGRLFDDTGTVMIPTYTVKGGSHRYRYYVSRPATRGETSNAAISQISAPPLEGVLSGALRRVGLPADEPWAAMHRMDVRAKEIIIRLKRAEVMAVWRSAVSESQALTDRQVLNDRRASR